MPEPKRNNNTIMMMMIMEFFIAAEHYEFIKENERNLMIQNMREK